MPRALAALLLSVAGGVWFTTAPSHAQEFCKDGGVNVVVDFQEMGGGVSQECVEDGGGKLAAQVFEDAGFDLTPVGAFPGVACQIEGKPTEAACQKMPPANAYWGLFLANGKTWDYAPKGADQLKLEEGAYVRVLLAVLQDPRAPAGGSDPRGGTYGCCGPGERVGPKGAKAPMRPRNRRSPRKTGSPVLVPILAVVALGAGVGAFLVARRRREGA